MNNSLYFDAFYEILRVKKMYVYVENFLQKITLLTKFNVSLHGEKSSYHIDQSLVLEDNSDIVWRYSKMDNTLITSYASGFKFSAGKETFLKAYFRITTFDF